jgi:PTS system nitrogen regulatory IIA component
MQSESKICDSVLLIILEKYDMEKENNIKTNTELDSLARLIERGGVYHKIPGNQPREILANLVGLLPACPGLDPVILLTAVLEREALMSTGIGKGIALPHPRTPLLKENDEPFVALAFLDKNVDWNTPDSSSVQTAFLIVSSSAKQHLNTLSKIHFLCQQENFITLIKTHASKDKIIATIQHEEKSWKKHGNKEFL